MSVKSSNHMRPGVQPQGFSERNRNTSNFDLPPQKEVEISRKTLTLPSKPTFAPPKMSDFVSKGKEEFTPTDVDGAVLDSGWERIDLPSRFVFYPWQEISIRRFSVMDQAKLFRAVRHKNITLLLDVLSSTCNRDVRELSYGDFQAVCIWHSLNSYLNSKQILTWTSKYGITSKAEIKKVVIKETSLDTTREEYLKWQSKGLAMSTCRDMELMASKSLADEEMLYLFDKAQFIDVEPLQSRIEELIKLGDRAATATARIEKVNQLGLQFFPVLDEFAEKFSDFGIQRIVTVTLDKKEFNLEKAIEALSQSEKLEDQTELEKLNELLEFSSEDKPVDYQPQSEEVPLSFELWSLFQYT